MKIGDPVKVNDRGMSYVKSFSATGDCTDPIPDTLEGVVFDVTDWILVRLPVRRPFYQDTTTDIWPFYEAELISIKQ